METGRIPKVGLDGTCRLGGLGGLGFGGVNCLEKKGDLAMAMLDI